MSVEEFKPNFLSDDESKDIATRQLLSFLYVNEEGRKKRAPSMALFSLSKIPPDAITEEPPLFKWKSRRIYDVDGVLLFWDQSIQLDDVNTLTVRTAASDLLRTPVWSVRAGKTHDFDTLIEKTRSALNDSGLKPVQEDETAPRLICYAYPKLGILAASVNHPNERYVVDLWERKPIPVEKHQKGHQNGHGSEPREESVKTVWSPYDLVTRATVDRYRARFQRQSGTLNGMPSNPARLGPAIAIATAGSTLKTTDPELLPVISQERSSYCAPATMAMILRHHGIVETQEIIASKMGTTSGGTYPDDQAEAVEELTYDALIGTLDLTTSFAEGKAEIIDNRPFKTGGVAHARACCGFMIESNLKEWLYIYDPMPVDAGDMYFEAWEPPYHGDYIYVRPRSSP